MEREQILKKIDGSNNSKRRIISISSCHKTNDGTYVFVGKSRLYESVRDTESKTDNVRQQFKSTCHE